MTVTAGLAVVSAVQQAAGILTQLLGLAALAGVLAAVLGVSYRWYTGSSVPQRLAVLVGVAGVAMYLGTTPALETVIRSDVEPTEIEAGLFNLGALLAGGGGAVLGRVGGDRFGTGVLLWSPTQDADNVGRLAQAVGRVTAVRLPAAVDDAAGYDPVPDRTKQRLAGKKLVFPRRLTVEQLHQRLTDRLKSDYGIGTIDIEIDDDGTVTHLAVGTRAAGIGSTLPPATNAVAVRADPGFSASTGDIVQVWESEPPRRMLTGELRGVADDVATIAVDAADTPKVDPTQQYRLVTLPVTDRPDREFASLLRAAEETFSSVTVEAGSPLHGMPVGALDLTITAIRPEDGDPVPFPERVYRLAAGDLLFVVARPAGIRKLEAAGTALDPSLASSSIPADRTEPAGGISTADEPETERTEPTGEDGLPTGQESDDQTADSSAVEEQAAANSFEEIKAQFETDQNAEGASPDSDSGEPAKETTTGDQAAEASGETAEAGASNDTGELSFDELKSEFESGEAEWGDDGVASETDDDDVDPGTDDDEEPDIEVAFTDESESKTSETDTATVADEDTDESDTTDESSGLVSLEEANITFEDERKSDESTESHSPDPDETEKSGTLGDLDIGDDHQESESDDVSDGIGNLEFDDDQSAEDDFGELGFKDEESAETDNDEESDDSDDEDSGGGGSSFADLKAEFESGEADWEDDVSDSPGGDMRLDE